MEICHARSLLTRIKICHEECHERKKIRINEFDHQHCKWEIVCLCATLPLVVDLASFVLSGKTKSI